jgi:hypothetical protein
MLQHKHFWKLNENGDLVANSHKILIRWKNYFSQLLNSCRDSEVRQMKIYTAEPLVPDHSVSEADIRIANFKIYTSLGTEKPPTCHIQLGGSCYISAKNTAPSYQSYKNIKIEI